MLGSKRLFLLVALDVKNCAKLAPAQFPDLCVLLSVILYIRERDLSCVLHPSDIAFSLLQDLKTTEDMKTELKTVQAVTVLEELKLDNNSHYQL